MNSIVPISGFFNAENHLFIPILFTSIVLHRTFAGRNVVPFLGNQMIPDLALRLPALV
jgi:hypothetical protein